MDILFFISYQPKPRFIKQLNFLSEKNNVTLLFFERTTSTYLNESISKNVKKVSLGYIPDLSKPVKRIFLYIISLRKVRKIVTSKSYDLVLVSNIDVLLLYFISKYSFFKKRVKPKIAIEISDLRSFVFGKRTTDKLLRYVEKKLYLNHIDKLIVTSEKFYTEHFKKFYNKEFFVLENKILSKEIKKVESNKKKLSSKTIIGIVALLTRSTTYLELFKTYKNDPDVEIHIHGRGVYQNLVEEYAAKYDNIFYFGSFNPFKNELQKIYDSIDMIYLVYDLELEPNHRIALPNKLYECMYYSVPILCSKDSYLEEIVLEYDIGTSINFREKGAIKSGVSFINKHKKEILDNFSRVEENRYIGDEDYVKLESFLKR